MSNSGIYKHADFLLALAEEANSNARPWEAFETNLSGEWRSHTSISYLVDKVTMDGRTWRRKPRTATMKMKLVRHPNGEIQPVEINATLHVDARWVSPIVEIPLIEDEK